MIILSKKSIHRWSYWRTKSKLFFCLSSGTLYAVLAFIVSLIVRVITGFDDSSLEASLGIALGSFLGGSFMSIALWYENERRYKRWKLK